MQLPNTRGQQIRDYTYDASGTIATGGTAQLILPERKSTSMWFFQNISDTDMYMEIGSARATAVLTGGVVTSVTITNGGFGFTRPPRVHFIGGASVGWNMQDSNYLGAGEIGYPAPSNFARGHAVLTAGAVSSIVVDNGGASYANPPYVFISNSFEDPFGCASPSATNGIFIPAAGGSYYNNGTAQSTDPLSIFCATAGKAFTCKWMA